MPEPDAFERIYRKLMALFGGHSAVDQRQFDVALRGKARNQVKPLENKADLLIADFRKLIVGHMRDVFAVEIILAARGHI